MGICDAIIQKISNGLIQTEPKDPAIIKHIKVIDMPKKILDHWNDQIFKIVLLLF
jgi:hypothetical protein